MMEKKLPEGWGIVKLGDYSTIFNGKTPSKNQQRKKGHPILKIKDINENGCFIGKFDSFVDDEFFEKNKAKCLKNGDTLILNAAHNSKYVGSKKAYISEFRDNIIPTGEWLIIRSNSELLDNRFKHFLLTSNLFKVVIKSIVKGIHLYPNDMKILKIPIPPLETQRKIVAILEKADETKKLRTQADELADRLLQSVFLEMFGDPVKNPMGWKTIKLGELGMVNSGLTLNGQRRANKNNLFPYLRVANVFRNKLNLEEIKYIHISDSEFERLILKKNDVLIVEGHGNIEEIGRAAVWKGEIPNCAHQNHLIRVRLDDKYTDPHFLSLFLNSYGNHGYFSSKSRTTSGLNTISANKVRDAKIPLPPLALQQKFAQIVDKVEEIRKEMKKSKQETDNLFNALAYKAFAGELIT